jgi:hypothetical protein
MPAIEVRPFRRRDRDQLTQLINAHAAVVVPGGVDHADFRAFLPVTGFREFTRTRRGKTAVPSWYEGVGHMPFLEDTERSSHELAAFVDQVRA